MEMMQMDKEDKDIVVCVAVRFAELLRESLTPRQWGEMRARNDNAPFGVCHSHDYLDANEVMGEALDDVTNREFADISPDDDPREDRMIALWNRAWNYARGTKLV